MSPEDAIAVATLAAARCAALGLTDIPSYLENFVRFEKELAAHRKTQAADGFEKVLGAWEKMAG